SLRQRYSPCSLKLVTSGLPLGAYFHTKSAATTLLLPVNATSRSSPVGAMPVDTRSCERVCRYETPASQLWLSAMSPPVRAYAMPDPTPFLLRGLPGNGSLLPTSPPSST